MVALTFLLEHVRLIIDWVACGSDSVVHVAVDGHVAADGSDDVSFVYNLSRDAYLDRAESQDSIDSLPLGLGHRGGCSSRNKETAR